MCTVTIRRAEDFFVVTMNRDELRGRAAEEPPERMEAASGSAWMAPLDGARGGTWFALNDRGVVGCMTNGPMPIERIGDFTGPEVPSRGAVLPMLMPMGELNTMLRYLKNSFTPNAYPPFQMILADSDATYSYAWRFGGRLQFERLPDEWVMVSSSVWHTAEVDRYRKRAFAEWLEAGAPEREGIPGFHLHFDPANPELSPRMEREHSRTRSITQAVVRSGSAPLLRYAPLPEAASDTHPTPPRLVSLSF